MLPLFEEDACEGQTLGELLAVHEGSEHGGAGQLAPSKAPKEEVFRDDLTGQLLNPELVKKARQKELEYFNAKGVWQKCLRQVCYDLTGKPPITVRWVDVNKGGDESPNYRSRRGKWQDPLFAPTPPLESLRTI